MALSARARSPTASARGPERSSVPPTRSERSGVVERPGRGDHAAKAHPAVRRLQSGNAAEGRGDADGAAGVATRREIAEARRDGDRAATARATGNARRVPGIGSWTEMRVLIRDAERPLVQVELAEEHSAGCS